MIAAFSLTKNIKKLMSTKTNENLSCLNGIRVLSIFWIIFGHTIEWADWNQYSKVFRNNSNYFIYLSFNQSFRKYIQIKRNIKFT